MNLCQLEYRVQMLKSPGELLKIIKKPNLVLVDCRPYEEYANGHIPGAVNLDLFHFHWLDTTKEGIRQFEKQTKTMLSFMGITQKKTVVFYDDISGMRAARGVWLLRYFSHRKVFMLDGGFKKWQSLRMEVETKTNGFKPAKFSGKTNGKVLAGFGYIKKNLDKIKIIDSRTEEEYMGAVLRASRKGHIPKAVNIDWSLNVKGDGTMKSPGDLSKLYKFSKDEEIVTYCQGGYRAANSFVALKMLGFRNVKVYLGSWNEWGNRKELPVEIVSKDSPKTSQDKK